jgi:putative lipoic acid-binding regulatory protein
MRIEIAVATVHGRAYYELVNELTRKRLPFLSLKPWDNIPFGIKVVLTTNEESRQISHPHVLILEQKTNPKFVIDEVFLIIHGKQSYKKVVIGVDPGKTCGIAILGDSIVLETLTSTNIEDSVSFIIDSLNRFPAEFKIVRVGDGTPDYTKTLVQLLCAHLADNVSLELVREAGTSRLATKSVNRRVLRDVVSAIKIAGRNGRPFSRRINE